jgi:hypothetical protein
MFTVLLDNRYGEQEYIVDRRRLRAVTMLERFEQCNPEVARHADQR